MKKENNKLTLSQEQKLEEWRKKIDNDDAAIKEAKNFLLTCCKSHYDVNERLKKVARELQPKILIKKKDLNDEELKFLNEVFYSIGIDSGFHLMEITPEKLQGLITDLRGNLIKEFNCTTYTEKILVDTIINAYIRNLNYSKRLLTATELGKANSNINSFIKEMSKEVDRANRHFLSSLQALKEIKQPELKVNIKTNTAFFGEKQEFNNNKDIKK